MKIKHEILVVDDMRDYREMLSLILQEKGYVVHIASCVNDAIKIIKSKKIEIVVTDLIIKDETGIQLLRWVKEDRKSTRLNSSHNRESRMPSSA